MRTESQQRRVQLSEDGIADKKHGMAIFLDNMSPQTIWSGFMFYLTHYNTVLKEQ